MNTDVLDLAQAGGGGGASAIWTVLAVAVIFLIVIRFMDLNEKESFGAILLVLAIGAAVGAILQTTLSSTIELDNTMGPIVVSGGIFVAILVGLLVLNASTRSKGWSALGSLMDGVVYGTTAGLGVALGSVIVSSFKTTSLIGDSLGAANNIGATALGGLAEGLFGAIIGAGFGAAVAGSAAKRAASVIGGLVLGAGLHILFNSFSRGNALAGGGERTKALIGLSIPVVFVVIVIAYALLREQKAIRDQLADEAAAGGVTSDELKLLDSFVARRALYAKTFFSGNFGKWRALRTLHNRQVQLALAEQRNTRESDADRKVKAQAEIDRLRSAIAEARTQASAGGAS